MICLVEEFKETYNTLQGDYFDPLFRKITSMEVTNFNEVKCHSIRIDCIISIEQCLFGTQFETVFVVTFDRDEDLLSDVYTGTLEESVSSTLNSL